MRKLCCASALALVAACGGDGHDVDPAIIVGGGVTDPGIDGEVNVFVIDEDSDAPLAGATVRVGAIEGTTDAAGLFVATGELVGKQTIVARATGYAASVWVGVDGANVTIPMTAATATSPDVPQATLAGTIAGWDSLPAPATGHATVAFVTYTQSQELGDDQGNDLPPPAPNANVCIRGPGPVQPCAWLLNARAGTIGVAAALADYDSKGTPDESDDTVTITGFALRHPVTVVDGVDQTGLVLDPLPAGSTTTASVDFGAPPAAFTERAGVVGVELGDLGVLRISQVTPTRNSVVVPSLSAVAGATGYELLAFAAEPVDDGTAGQSIVLRRGITSPSSLAAGEWLAAPAGLASDRSSVSFTPTAGAFAHVVEIETAPAGGGDGIRAMTVVVLDDTTTVALPVDLAPLPTGALTVTASAFDPGAGFDVRDFEIEALLDAIQRLAGETIRLD